MTTPREATVESAQLLIEVNDLDEPLAPVSREACHQGEGVLHRAFSIFILDDDGNVLLQRRSARKQLWPLFWSNACCSHPRYGEESADAAHRRMREELGIATELRFLFKFSYHAPYLAVGCERELCWVWIGRTSAPVAADPSEIAEHRYVAPATLDREIRDDPGRFTPWLQLEWQRLRSDFRDLWD